MSCAYQRIECRGRTAYATWITSRHTLLKKELRTTGYSTIEPTPWFCSESFCPAVIGNLLVYRDASHMTATYSEWLAPLIQPTLVTAGRDEDAKTAQGPGKDSGA